MRALIVAALCAVALAAANGWGDKIEWEETLESALARARLEGKPAMVIIHKSWCGACKQLKPLFAGSDQIAEESQRFVMVNLLDDAEPADDEYKPDGGYIPRILFVEPSTGRVDPTLINEGGHAKYKYFYSSPTAIVQSMKRAAIKLTVAAPGDGEL